jgi:hypothetical protein
MKHRSKQRGNKQRIAKEVKTLRGKKIGGEKRKK